MQDKKYKSILKFINEESPSRDKIIHKIIHSNSIEKISDMLEKVIIPKLLFFALCASLLTYYILLYICILNGFTIDFNAILPLFITYIITFYILKFVKNKIR